MSLTTVDAGLLGTQAQYTGFKNRIINGAMVIDQRNAGASITVAAGNSGYPVDRFRFDSPAGQSITGQQVAASLSGFQSSVRYTAGTASTNAGDQSEIVHFIEGYNVADMQFGTANAQTFTLSFWAKSSLTGTFGLVIENAANNRQYLTTYSLPTANTWTYITKTIVGDTSGTWDYTNGRGLSIRLDMGAGTTFSAVATNAWGTSSVYGITGAVKLTQTTGATFQVTGVQLEKGNTATSFDYRPYGTELALCQRYYQNIIADASPNPAYYGMGAAYTSGATLYSNLMLPVQMRALPTVNFTVSSKVNLNTPAAYARSSGRIEIQSSSPGGGDTYLYASVFNASAEL
jgi:hypothetical protein